MVFFLDDINIDYTIYPVNLVSIVAIYAGLARILF